MGGSSSPAGSRSGRPFAPVTSPLPVGSLGSAHCNCAKNASTSWETSLPVGGSCGTTGGNNPESIVSRAGSIGSWVAKGRMRPLLAHYPVRVVLYPDCALRGAAQAAADALA